MASESGYDKRRRFHAGSRQTTRREGNVFSARGAAAGRAAGPPAEGEATGGRGRVRKSCSGL
ncbi:hypothetical protein ebB246 [Aromatoleum aromaticum EbN1]|uniref:Uncharacterized protein n=1 Tax=Aromatoleum aromaticum (strain DSM 19018 / LMG 30748 / EbN1) TaxID=76114 RepID=Q5NXN3_AROAE|nr:hypothetical protein ebB246 [Aromatoleum aromaticum EbN1]